MDANELQNNLRRDLLLAAVRGIQSGLSSDEAATGTIKSAELLSEAISVSVKTQVKDVLEKIAHQQAAQAAAGLTQVAEQLLGQQSNTPGRASIPIHRNTLSQSNSSSAATQLSGSLTPHSPAAQSHKTTFTLDQPQYAGFSSKRTQDDGLLFGQTRSNESDFSFGQRCPMSAAASGPFHIESRLERRPFETGYQLERQPMANYAVPKVQDMTQSQQLTPSPTSDEHTPLSQPISTEFSRRMTPSDIDPPPAVWAPDESLTHQIYQDICLLYAAWTTYQDTMQWRAIRPDSDMANQYSTVYAAAKEAYESTKISEFSGWSHDRADWEKRGGVVHSEVRAMTSKVDDYQCHQVSLQERGKA